LYFIFIQINEKHIMTISRINAQLVILIRTLVNIRISNLMAIKMIFL